MKLGVFLDGDKGQKPSWPEQDGHWEFDDVDFALYALLCDPIYCAELLCESPNNREYGGAYQVRDYQYELNRGMGGNYEIYACSRAVGKTEAVKNRAMTHAFRRMGENLLITTPELIHLLPLTDAIEDRIQNCRLTREFLDTGGGRTGFTHRPFGVDFQDNTKIVGRIPRLSGVGVKSQHQPDLIVDECFPAGTLVLTERGQVPIEDVRVGDEVFTHRNRWRKVTATATRERPTVRLVGQGHPGLVCSEHHPLWCKGSHRSTVLQDKENRRMRAATMFKDGSTRKEVANAMGVSWTSADKWFQKFQVGGDEALLGALATATRRDRQSWSRPGDARMVPACDLVSDMNKEYWSSPCEFPPAALPEMPIGVIVNDDFWWLLGFYAAEGCVHRNGRQLTFSVHRDEVGMVRKRLARIGIESSAHYEKDSLAARVTPLGAVRYARWLEEHVGRVAAEHEAKPWLLGQSGHVRELVLDGYVTGDGNLVKDDRYCAGRWQVASRDRKLVLSMKLLAQSLGYFVGLYWTPARDMEIRGRPVHSTGWYQLRGNRRSQSAFVEDGKQFSLVRHVTPEGTTATLYDLTVEEDHSFVAETLACSNSQDYPENGWTEVHETVNRDSVDQAGNPDFSYVVYGVHSGARDTGFFRRAQGGGFKMAQVTALQRPSWCAAEKEAAKAAYGGTSAPDYRRNILGEAGAASSPLFVIARLIACMDQDRSTAYNQSEYVVQEIHVEAFDELMLPIADVLDLPSGLKRVWCGADLGLTNSPTVILIFSEEKIGGTWRLKLVRRIHLNRMRVKQIRNAIYAIFSHFGEALQGFGIDETGLGFPIMQEIEDDEGKPALMDERFSGWFFNAKCPVGVEKGQVTADQAGNLRDQYGNTVQVRINELTNAEEYVVYMPMIEASTRYLREFVDTTFFQFPFDPEVIGDMNGDSQQRVKRIAGLKQKPNAFHILDAMRAMSMKYKSADVAEAIAQPAQRPVMDGWAE